MKQNIEMIMFVHIKYNMCHKPHNQSSTHYAPLGKDYSMQTPLLLLYIRCGEAFFTGESLPKSEIKKLKLF
jgi:hypothetical protein